MTFDEEKFDMATKIYDYALEITKNDANLAIGLLLKIISISCAVNDDPLKAFQNVHDVFDEYEEIENRWKT
jgi:hypothetical protein